MSSSPEWATWLIQAYAIQQQQQQQRQHFPHKPLEQIAPNVSYTTRANMNHPSHSDDYINKKIIKKSHIGIR